MLSFVSEFTLLLLLMALWKGLGDITRTCDIIGLQGGSGAGEVRGLSISWTSNITSKERRGLVRRRSLTMRGVTVY